MTPAHVGRTIALSIATLALPACATKGFVREQISASAVTTQASVVAARDSAVATANASRSAADEALEQRIRTRVDSIATQVESLRSDLQSLRNDFNAEVTAMKDSIKFEMPVHFGFDDATVRTEDSPALARFAAVVKKYYPDARVTVEGFADPAGTESYNRALSKRRAESVRTALVSQGLDLAHLNVVGYGKTRLVNAHAQHDQPGAEMNRRVVFAIETVGSAISADMLNQSGQHMP